jgi:2,3-bisphosphoglycerate-independent phosphoglycerate mutase
LEPLVRSHKKTLNSELGNAEFLNLNLKEEGNLTNDEKLVEQKIEKIEKSDNNIEIIVSEEKKKLEPEALKLKDNPKPIEIIEIKVGIELSHNGKKYKLLKKIRDDFFETVYLASE